MLGATSSARRAAIAQGGIRTPEHPDERLVRRLSRRPRPGLDRSMALLSGAADRGLLWLGVAAVIAAAVPEPTGEDGGPEDIELAHLSVINASVFGGFLGMRLRDPSPDDGRLDVLAVENAALRRTVAAAALRSNRNPVAMA